MSKEAMKLALEALEKADSRDGYLTYITEIEALREALAEQPAPATELRQQEPPTVAELVCVCGAEWEWRNRDWELVTTPPAQPQREPVSDRENAIIRFALHQFMSNAYSNMNAAAQDKDSRHYTVGAVEKFAKDAKDAEALLSRLQFKAPQPAQRKPWVGLTEQEAAECWSTSTVRTWQAIEAKLREKNA